ncbi:MAG TPA: SpoIIE family protein phosphatase [Candidatus Aquicultor sp.]|jgi:PAS domain S-box-containing protein
MRRLSITRKLIIIYLVIAIPLIAITTIVYISWYQGRVERVLLERNEIASLAGTSFLLHIRELGRSMEFVSEPIITNRFPPPEAAASLSVLLPDYPIDYALITNQQGIVTASTDTRFIGQNLSKNPAFATIINSSKLTGIAPSEKINDRVGFYVAQAIKRNGQLQGITASFVDVSKLGSELPKIPSGGINIVDSSDRLVYQSQFPDLALTRPYWGKYDFVRAALSGRSASSTTWVFPVTHQVRFVAEVPIPEIGWAAGSGMDRSVALAPVNRIAFMSAFAVFIFLTVAFAVSIYVARGIVSSLATLVSKARAVGEGRFDDPVILTTGDEVEAVARSLDTARLNLKHTVEELRKARDELEIRVRERTAELSDITTRMQSLLESTDEGIYGIDTNERCTLFNRSATKMTGYESEEMLGKSVHDLIHYKHNNGSPYPLKECPIFLTTMVGQGKRIDTEVFWRKDGTAFPVEYSSNPIIEEGVIKGAVVAFTDITERKKAEELSNALDDINAAISSILDINEIMRRVVAEAAQAIGAESSIIFLRADDRWVARYSYRYPEDIVDREFTDEELTYPSIVAKTGEILVVEDTHKDASTVPEIVKRYGIKSCICVPLQVKQNVIGVLTISYFSTPVPFTRAQIDSASKLAATISLALENARLYETERHIADTLQEALLILPQEIKGISSGSLYRSASEAAKVGGDFYDLFELEHERVGIVVGDVSGKGLEASTLTSITKNTLKAYAYEEDSPSAVVAKTNDVITKESSSGSFITLFFGILELATGNLTYCNAGHPAPIIKRGKSDPLLLIANSPVIGAFLDLSYTDEHSMLEKTDILILYTDGVIEARCPDGFLGEARLVALVKEPESVSAKDLPRFVFNAVMDCTGNALSDDIAILAVSIASE